MDNKMQNEYYLRLDNDNSCHKYDGKEWHNARSSYDEYATRDRDEARAVADEYNVLADEKNWSRAGVFSREIEVV